MRSAEVPDDDVIQSDDDVAATEEALRAERAEKTKLKKLAVCF